MQAGPPSTLKSTVPPDGMGETVAVKVTFCPYVDGFTDEITLVVVEVDGALTVTVGDVPNPLTNV